MSLIIDSIVNGHESVTVNIDGYVPFVINLVDSNGIVPLYWRVGDGHKSLLEMAVLPQSGFLSEITLVMMDIKSIHKVESEDINFTCEEAGLPVVNLDLWKSSGNNDFSQRFIDEFNVEIQAYMSRNTLLIKIFGGFNKTRWIRCGDNFYLGVNERGGIENLFINGLSEGDLSNFTASIV